MGRIRMQLGLQALAVFCEYVAVARLDAVVEPITGVATMIGPASGVALAALALRGLHLWPAIALAAFVECAWRGLPVTVALCVMLGNTLQAVVGATCLIRLGGYRYAPLDTPRDVLALIGPAALGSTLIGASVGVLGSWLGDLLPASQLMAAGRTWWLGDVLGDLTAAPLVFALRQLRFEPSQQRRVSEAVLTLTVLVAVALLTFCTAHDARWSPRAYLLFPPMLWAALRFHHLGAVVSTLLVAAISFVGTGAGLGPFAHLERANGTLALEGFVCIAAMSSLVLAAVSAERKHAVDALGREHAFVSAILDVAGLLVVLDREGRVVRVNRACESAFGAGALHGLIGRCFWETFADPGERDHAKLAVERVIAGSDDVEWEGRCHSHDRQERVVRWSGTRIDNSGKAVLVIMSGNDLTHCRKLEAQLVVSDRLAAMGRLAAGVSHEINNPITYMLISLDRAKRILERGKGASEPVEAELTMLLDLAREGADRVRVIVGDLKTMTCGAQTPPAPLDVRKVLDACIQVARSELTSRARLVTDYEDVPQVSANESRLGHVFLSLLMNAAQAIPEGHADQNEVRVRVRVSGEHVLVEVIDSGVGVDPAACGRVFEPFFTTKAAGEGTGLGLAVAHALVTSLGGTITLDSVVGRGTTLRVALPI